MGKRMKVREVVRNAENIMAMRKQLYGNIPLSLLSEYLADSKEWRPDVESGPDGYLGKIDLSEFSELPDLKEAVVIHRGHTLLVTSKNGGNTITISISKNFQIFTLHGVKISTPWEGKDILREMILRGLARLVLPN